MTARQERAWWFIWILLFFVVMYGPGCVPCPPDRLHNEKGRIVCLPPPEPSASPTQEPSNEPTPATPEPSAQPSEEPTPRPTPNPCALPSRPDCGPACCRSADRGEVGEYEADVIAAVDLVIESGAYSRAGRVTDQAGYLGAIAAELRLRGYCAEVSGAWDEVAVKLEPGWNEQYDVIAGGDVAQLVGLASVCTPARF